MIFSDVVQQIAEARRKNTDIKVCEVGPDTWEAICYVVADNPEALNDLTILGVKVRRNREVPEGMVVPI